MSLLIHSCFVHQASYDRPDSNITDEWDESDVDDIMLWTFQVFDDEVWNENEKIECLRGWGYPNYIKISEIHLTSLMLIAWMDQLNENHADLTRCT